MTENINKRLLELVNAILDNRSACFIPTTDPNSPTFDWDERAREVVDEAQTKGN